MPVTYLKKADKSSATGEQDVRATVQAMLNEIEAGGDAKAAEYAAKFDKWDEDIVVSAEARASAVAKVNQKLKDDIAYAHENVRLFAEAQKATIADCEIELRPGLIAGQKQIPMQTAGCYVPGGRYAHIASAIMTVTTAKVAEVDHITVCSPPKPASTPPSSMPPTSAVPTRSSIWAGSRVWPRWPLGCSGRRQRIFWSGRATSSSPRPSGFSMAGSASTCLPDRPRPW
jgi:histidinol dehydrogenase